MMRTLFPLVVSIGLVGCIGGIDAPPMGDDEPDPDPVGATAKEMFDNNVFSVISTKCSGGGCHTETGQASAPIRFVALEAANGHQVAISFTALVGNFAPSTAGILTQIVGQN